MLFFRIFLLRIFSEIVTYNYRYKCYNYVTSGVKPFTLFTMTCTILLRLNIPTSHQSYQITFKYQRLKTSN